MSGLSLDRRALLARAATGLAALSTAPLAAAADAVGRPHHRPRAKRLVYLFQSGGPSQLDLFDHKPELARRHGEELPESVRAGQRLTAMSGNQSSLPLVGSPFRFAPHGQCGAWVSELLPYTARVVDELCFLKAVHTEAINHDPAITCFLTGSPIAGRPSLGAWLSYGLGSLNPDLPEFVVLITRGKSGQPLYSRLWGSGFLPARHQGVVFRAGAEPVLFLGDPPGVSRALRRASLDALAELHALEREREGDVAVDERTQKAELAWRMQVSVPEATDLAGEPDEVFELYGEDARRPGTFAANCLLARRLIERDVRCVQLFHQGWDQHGTLPGSLAVQCRETDQAASALVVDLERRGLLEDTLVAWGGEFGRTAYCQGKLTPDGFGRDHHPRSSTVWLAGGGVRAGYTRGATDELGYNVVEGGVDVHDLNALILHLFGIDHERLTFRYQGRRYRLTDVSGVVPGDVLA